MKTMEKFIKIYNESISAEKELENSTELKDENIQNESLGKWAKTFFKGNKSNLTEFKKTILSALKSFNFRYERGKNGGKIRNKFAKRQGDYEIYIDVDPDVFEPKSISKQYQKYKYKGCSISMRIVETATKEEIVKDKIIKAKLSWTVEEFQKAFDEVYFDACDEHLDDSYLEINNKSDQKSHKR